MRMAYVCADAGFPIFGSNGTSIRVQETLRSFLKLDAGVACFTPRIEGCRRDLGAIRVHELPITRAQGRDGEIAAVEANGALGCRLSREAPFDFVYERFSVWSYSAMEMAKRHGIPGILEVNAPLIEEQIRYRALYDVGSAWSAAFRSWNAAQAIVAVSDGVAEYLEQFEAARGKVTVIPNGVDAERFRPEVLPARPTARPVIGFVGSFTRSDGVDLLIDAFAQVAAVDAAPELLLVGDGPERPALEVEVKRVGLAHRVHFTGAVPVEKVPNWVASMDVAVAPYPDGDAYFSPLEVYEYMASGRAIVATRVRQLAQVLNHDLDAVLVEPGRTNALAEAIHGLTRHAAHRERLGRAAREQAKAQHSWGTVAQRVLEVGGLTLRLPVAAA